MSVNAVDWALRFAPVDARHNGAARVLMCLANVADDEGRNAHPTHRKLAAWCKCSVSTVKRHLSWLEANGLIRRGDQRQAGHFSEWHRPVVWDLCLGNRLELDPDFFDSNDIDSTRGGRPSTENRARGNPGSHVDRGYGDGDTGKPQLTGEPRFTAVTPPPAHLVSYSTSLVRNNPSAPTGHLPAGGATPARDEKNDDGTTIVLDRLAAVRSRLSLSTATPTGRDRDRVSKLVDRVTEAHDGDHAAALTLILAVIDWLPANTFWLRRVDSARRLADNWDQIANDWTVAQIERQRERDAEAHERDRRSVAQPTPVPERHSERHVHSLVCEHVLNDMRPHEDEYDHEGSLRYGKPSEWQMACMRHADELNRRDGISTAA